MNSALSVNKYRYFSPTFPAFPAATVSVWLLHVCQGLTALLDRLDQFHQVVISEGGQPALQGFCILRCD